MSLSRLLGLPTCREASHLLSRRQDAPLSRGQSLRLRLHLAACDACANFARQLDFLREALRRYRE